MEEEEGVVLIRICIWEEIRNSALSSNYMCEKLREREDSIKLVYKQLKIKD